MHIVSPTSTPRPPVGSVVQAVAILRHLGSLAEGAGVNAIARATGIGPSSCFNVLRTLVGEDMVRFDPATKLYRLGLGTVDLARMALARDALVNVARGPMAQMAEEHDAAVGLWRLSARDTDHERLTLMALAESDAATRIHMLVGQRQPAMAGATGRAVLAARTLPDAAVLDAYAGVRWREAPGADKFLRQVRDAEARGWAADNGNINHGISTVASAIRERSGAVRFVLSVSIFGGRESAAGLAAIGKDLSTLTRTLETSVYGQMGEE
ncbi:MAG: IclR family transcriptional regulator C-terminal domain-containing protein [Sphingobium sp.]